MGYVLLFIVVFVMVTLIKGSIEKKKRGRYHHPTLDEFDKGLEDISNTQNVNEKTGKIAELNRKMDEKTAWLEADTKRMQAERARRKAAKEAEKQAKIEFKNRNK